jgi:hypothetical protein
MRIFTSSVLEVDDVPQYLRRYNTEVRFKFTYLGRKEQYSRESRRIVRQEDYTVVHRAMT